MEGLLWRKMYPYCARGIQSIYALLINLHADIASLTLLLDAVVLGK